MSGWRIFGIEADELLEFSLHLRGLEIREYDKLKKEDGFIIILKGGYGRMGGPADPELLEVLESRAKKRGYYVEMNDTTDTGSGWIRFEKGDDLVMVHDLVAPEEELPGDMDCYDSERAIFDGRESKLPEFQLGAPGHFIIYELLSREGMPALER